MHLLGYGPKHPLQRAIPWIVTLVVFAALVAATFWIRAQLASQSGAEQQVVALREQLAHAHASLTAVVQARGAANATAQARANDPAVTVERALRLAFEAYQDPSEGRLRALTEVFQPSALAIFRNEAEHLVSSGWRLAGDSTYDVEILSATALEGSERARVRTRERWVYDEYDAAGRQARCVVEEGEQTYVLGRVGQNWQIEEVELGTTRRTDC